MSKGTAWSFGKMNAVQTRNAMYYINETNMTSAQIARRVSKYKNAPTIRPTTISSLRSYLNTYEV